MGRQDPRQDGLYSLMKPLSPFFLRGSWRDQRLQGLEKLRQPLLNDVPYAFGLIAGGSTPPQARISRARPRHCPGGNRPGSPNRRSKTPSPAIWRRAPGSPHDTVQCGHVAGWKPALRCRQDACGTLQAGSLRYAPGRATTHRRGRLCHQRLQLLCDAQARRLCHPRFQLLCHLRFKLLWHPFSTTACRLSGVRVEF